MSMEEEWSIEGIEKIQPTAIKQIQSIVAKNRIGHAYIIEGANGTGKTKVMQFLYSLCFAKIRQKMFHVKHVETVKD